MGIEWLVIAIIAAVAITAGVLVPYFVFGRKESSPPPKPPENMDPPEPPPEEEPISSPPPASHQQETAEPVPPMSPPVAPTVEKTPEYLGNSNTGEIHDLSNIQSSCQIDRMSEEHKVYFDNIEEAKKAMETQEYNGCRWCLSQYHTD